MNQSQRRQCKKTIDDQKNLDNTAVRDWAKNTFVLANLFKDSHWCLSEENMNIYVGIHCTFFAVWCICSCLNPCVVK